MLSEKIELVGASQLITSQGVFEFFFSLGNLPAPSPYKTTPPLWGIGGRGYVGHPAPIPPPTAGRFLAKVDASSCL